ncbi:zinc-dependent alcohol dehydrogenase [Labedaea rhizosphaerae]|uniref:D-arabinose 1-dehydrogenase-like Zn-dependent alcohol dehydrogenase n=1 Tax=Labedaea rhizosphaerae TaxID=598644 RepID=A0A4R6SFC9_LABRH|nr:alcohol dehydrogenase catalytic domain-containing protein [Labedaea rhizosphaerae]TDQ00274.1 D-arabinose 1-dehydrogenase-like Zn-dependent alcohol dehydrogenase [Labedaea rhizosphaerae]
MTVVQALVLTGPGQAEVRAVPAPVAADGEVVIDVHRVGVCGTDVELFTGDMSYLQSGITSYPIRPGHEWAGEVTAVGLGVDPAWLGRKVTGDTMIGCGHCERCALGRHHVCAERHELGIRGGMAGALAERLALPVRALHALPDTMDATLGAMVEPGGNALRCVEAARTGPGDRILVLGTGTIGLLVALFARARGAEVHLVGRQNNDLELARALGFANAWTREVLPARAWHAVVDATNAPTMPALALDLVEPGGRIVYIGLAGAPSTIDTRELAFRDVTAVGILGGSAGLDGAIAAYADGSVDPRQLVAATVALTGAADVLRGNRPPGAGPGPKIHIDPRT